MVDLSTFLPSARRSPLFVLAFLPILYEFAFRLRCVFSAHSNQKKQSRPGHSKGSSA